MAKVLNSSKLLNRIPDRPTNYKNSLRTVQISKDLHDKHYISFAFYSRVSFLAFSILEVDYTYIYHKEIRSCRIAMQYIRPIPA